MRAFIVVVLTGVSLAACSSETAKQSLHDSGATDQASISGSGGGAGTPTGGGSGNGGAAGGTGGATAGRDGSAAETAGPETGSGADARRDAEDSSIADVAQDSAAPTDTPPSSDSGSCVVGTTRPAGDGCNTCRCQSGNVWACTTAQCVSPDSGCSDGACDLSDAHTQTADSGTSETGTTACAQLTTETACQARSDCHAVYVDPNTCGCLGLGCCTRFNRCADGGKAACTIPATFACTVATPYCATPKYVLSYTANCYEGCVLAAECGS